MRDQKDGDTARRGRLLGARGAASAWTDLCGRCGGAGAGVADEKLSARRCAHSRSTGRRAGGHAARLTQQDFIFIKSKNRKIHVLDSTISSLTCRSTAVLDLLQLAVHVVCFLSVHSTAWTAWSSRIDYLLTESEDAGSNLAGDTILNGLV